MDGDNSSLSILKPLCDKVNILKLNVEFLKCLKFNTSESMKVIKEIHKIKDKMMENIEQLNHLLDEQVKLSDNIRVQNVEISHLLYKVNTFDKIIVVKKANESYNCGNTNGSIIYTNGDTTPHDIQYAPSVDGKSGGSSYEEFSPMQLNVGPPILNRDSRLRLSIAFDISYVTEREFKEIPKYMVGRITLAEINKFIDIINEALSKKYNLLSKPMRSVKQQEMTLYKSFKRQQTVQLKGRHFVTEEDMAREAGKRILDKKAHNYLTILRHVKRLMRDVINGCVIYIVDNSVP